MVAPPPPLDPRNQLLFPANLLYLIGLKLCLKMSKTSGEAGGYAQIFIFDQKLVDCRIA